MDNQSSQIRTRLSEAWQAAARNFIAAGVPGDAVFGTLLATGLAGLVEIHGKADAAKILLQLADTIDREVSEEAAAVKQATIDAALATRN